MKNLTILSFALIFSTFLLSCQSQDEMMPAPSTLENEFYSSKMKAQTAMEHNFGTFINGREEVPSVAASGSGYANFHLSEDETSLSYQLFVANTEGILFSHIHMAPAGENGPVVAFLLEAQDPPTPLFNGLLAEGVIMTEDLLGPLSGMTLNDLIKAIKDGNTYVNVHTVENPSGELRGQIGIQEPSMNGKYAIHLTGDEEVPEVDTGAQGNATFKFNHDWTELHYKINVANLTDALFAHIHIAPAGVNGGVVVTLQGEMINGPINGHYAEGIITNEDLSGIMTGGSLGILKAALDGHHAYVNIHSTENPGGELRGQF
ncbi:CHRD domain-containing protein [Echinicola jeungdonensis]|uniref:CHRD domain-containing protein n=1 Tax=Echinicola jeungdonensis TaxID=709343 RepID=A0ABV5J9J2_9BACT|nr:CHRD domain-containing protein [Echinicola jeungdonensis]MDN3669742.1 CHRD domain-containing protein [Echinicola jeungdonensis]